MKYLYFQKVFMIVSIEHTQLLKTREISNPFQLPNAMWKISIRKELRYFVTLAWDGFHYSCKFQCCMLSIKHYNNGIHNMLCPHILPILVVVYIYRLMDNKKRKAQVWISPWDSFEPLDRLRQSFIEKAFREPSLIRKSSNFWN